ncbi:uncharacterized protein IL334_005464 [Kwoniella shivajii]|uniref:Suppressor of action mutation 2-like protein n=1 Tax=Kwoniella shivajii TaxID=564305 RepID=A0ABZ1D3W1_9TREE|nr:hypothetical protein IL334_005464 [Kwoniella shivajii]
MSQVELPNGHSEDKPLETPGAGPSRLPSIDLSNDEIEEIDEEEQDRLDFLKKQSDYLELAQSVNSSDQLLSSLASYLSTFQNDLSAVSGQISDLQGRSSEIESQLKGRKTILPPLNALLSDIIIPPSLVLTIRDTSPNSNPDLWLSCVIQLDEKITLITESSKSKSKSNSNSSSKVKAKAIDELTPIIEGLKLRIFNVLPNFLLGLIRPLKSSSKGLSTNLAVLQTSILLKYQPFYSFLLKHSSNNNNGGLAKQVERGYVNASRSYYETAIRRYTRSLQSIKYRIVDKQDLIGSSTSSSENTQAILNNNGNSNVNENKQDKLIYKDLDAEGEQGAVVLAYMADDKDFRAPVEALFRSVALVLLDNASSEFTFIVRFFGRSLQSSLPPPAGPSSSIRSPLNTPMDSPNPSFNDMMSDAGKSTTPISHQQSKRKGVNEMTENLKDSERIWHEIFDSSLEYTTSFFQSIISSTPPPSAISLLTMIRLNDNLLSVADSRGCLPLISYLTGWKLSLWPVYRKEMDNHIDSLKKLADDAEGKGLASFIGKSIKDGQVRQVSKKYGEMFSCVVALSQQAEEAMMFSSMTRLRNELIRLLTAQSGKIKSLPEKHSFLSSIYEIIMYELVSGPGQTTHPKLQSELSYFRTREEEARRRISA